jgi:hypothetical protein
MASTIEAVDESIRTATTHIGMFTRTVPLARWRKIALLMSLLIALAVGAWEWQMRAIGLRAGDLDDGKPQWAVERRKIDTGPRDQVAIIGDSRSLYDTNLDVWQQLTGKRPIQLAIAGEWSGPYLNDLAEDQQFAGLVVLGFAEGTFFSNGPMWINAMGYARTESLSQRAGLSIQNLLSHGFAFLDRGYALFALIDQLNVPVRKGTERADWFARFATHKLGETFADRQTVMWSGIEADPSGWRNAWTTGLPVLGSPVPPTLVRQVIDRTQHDIDKIRSRGGEVVFLRPPSDGPFFQGEQRGLPREKIWDPLVRDTHSFGIYFNDYPSMKGLTLPEWSHLTRVDAKKFTAAYVGVLCEQLPWLRAHGAHCRM